MINSTNKNNEVKVTSLLNFIDENEKIKMQSRKLNLFKNKSKNAVFLFLFLLISSFNVFAQTPQYIFQNGTGGNSIPFGGGTWADQRNQWFYAPGDFANATSGKAIKRMYLRVGTITGATTWTNLKISMGQPNITSGGLTTAWVTGLTQVYFAASRSEAVTTAGQWIYFDLQTPFPYNPNKPLVIETIQTATTGGKDLQYGGGSLNPNFTGNTQTYGASAAATGTSRVGSYACGLDLISLGPNNAGIESLTNPVNFCSGSYDVKVNVQNAGTNMLDSVRVSWSIDGTFQNTQYITKRIDTAGTKNGTTLNITLGNVNFSAGVLRTIKVWTSFPNGVKDTVNDNDTLIVKLKPSISGTFTIGGTNPDYATFTAAVSDLNSYGICGPVIFKVAAGTYTDRITLNPINGTSATNTIQFIGAGKTSTTLTNTGSSTANMNTITMNGADYVTFRDMTIAAPNVTYGVGILLTNQADYNKFINLNINCNNTATGATTAGIAATGSTTTLSTLGDNANYTLVDSVNVDGGYYGISFYGISTSAKYSTNNTVTNCKLTNIYYYGLRMYGQDKYNVSFNKMSGFRNATCYGMYSYYSSNFELISNEIYTTYASAYLYYNNRYNYDNKITTKVHNNIFHTTGNYFAYNPYYADYIQMYHNTVVGNMNSTGTVKVTGGGAGYFYYAVDNDIQNNIFVNNQTGTTAWAVYFDNSTPKVLDNNIYYSYGTVLAYYNAADQIDLSTWKDKYPLFNINSIQSAPFFKSSTDGHLDFSNPAPSGPFIDVTFDVDNQTRCDLAPTIGADESNFPLPPPNAYFAVADTTFINSNSRFINTSSTNPKEKVKYTWYVDGVKVSTDKDLIYTFSNNTNYKVSMKIENCFGYDSTGKTIKVEYPTSTPITDFIANKTIAEINEEIQLFSISKHGATSWTWTVNTNDASFSDDTEANPTITFKKSGAYDVCLTTANHLGQGSTTCKKNYISINENVVMCGISNKSNSPVGNISDDGGLKTNYSNNEHCFFAIQPCATSVNLKFNTFGLSDAGDSIAIYDGPNNKGIFLGSFTGSYTGLPGGTKGFTANSGTMYIEWNTSSSGVAPGFDANWTSIIDTNVSAPTANFTFPKNIYTNQEVTFTSTSTGKNIQYTWDFIPPANLSGLDGGKNETDRYKWTTPGTKNVQLIASNCGGADVVSKQITVVDITSAPKVNFGASKTRVPVISQITLIDSSDQAPTSYKWEITPANKVVYVNSKTSRNPIVYFTSPGFYTVKLVASNALGADSLAKTNYIEVFSYCTPAVAALSSDVGISRVRYENIDNITTIGQTNYTSYFDKYTPPIFFKGSNFDITIDRSTNKDSMSRKVWIDWNQNGVFTDAGELVAVENASKQLSFIGNIQVPSTVPVGVTIMRVGTSYASANNTPCGINPSGEFEDYPLEIRVDNIKPVITKSGADILYVEQWYALNDPGVTVFDNLDGDITNLVFTNTNFDSTTVGTYTIRYNSTDNSGNIANEVTRTVVVTPDVTPAVITLNGNAIESVEVFDNYNDAGAVAMDYFNRDISSNLQSSDNIDLNVLGNYQVIYTVTDGGGNITTENRTVDVIDKTAPVITTNGTADTIYINVFANLNDPGFTAIDNYDQAGDIVLTYDSTAFNSNKIGTYIVKYFATDLSGNIGTKNIVVIVQDKVIPTIILVGKNDINVDVYTDYIEQGVIVKDNYCTNGKWTIAGNVDTDIVGPYTITYSSIDCQGNKAIDITRTVNVIDRVAPVIKLKGLSTVNIKERENYTEEGFTIEDNYYDDATLQPLVKTTDNVDNTKGGVYSICYNVTDPSNNKSKQVCRTVNVKAFGAGIDNVLNKNIQLFPNPNNGEFTIESKDGFNNTEIVVIDLLGKVIYSTKANGTNEVKLNLNDVAAGIYMVNIHEGNQAQNIKISVVK